MTVDRSTSPADSPQWQAELLARPAGSQRRAYQAGLLVILILAAAVRCWLITHAVAVGRDAAGHYLPQAQAFSRMHLDRAFHAGIPPLYPALSGLTAMLVSDVELACRLVSLVSGLTAVLLAALLAGRLFGHWAGLLAAALIAFHPYQCRFSAEVGPDALAVALLLAVTVVLIDYLLTPGLWRAAALGAILALLALARPESALYAPPVILLMALFPPVGRFRIDPRRLAHAGLLIAVALVLCLPRLLWVHHQTGMWVVDTRQIDWPIRLWQALTEQTYHYGQLTVWRQGGLKAAGDSLEALMASLGPATLLLGIYALRCRTSNSFRRLQWVPALLLIMGILLALVGCRLSKRYLLGPGALWQIWGAAGLAMLACLIWSHLRRTKPSARPIALPYLLAAATALLQLPWTVVNLKQSRLAERRMGQWILDTLGPDQQIISRDAIPAWYARGQYVPWPTLLGRRRCLKELAHRIPKTEATLIVYDDRDEQLNTHCPRPAEYIAAGSPPLGSILHQIHDGRRTLTLLRVRRPPSKS